MEGQTLKRDKLVDTTYGINTKLIYHILEGQSHRETTPIDNNISTVNISLVLKDHI